MALNGSVVGDVLFQKNATQDPDGSFFGLTYAEPNLSSVWASTPQPYVFTGIQSGSILASGINTAYVLSVFDYSFTPTALDLITLVFAVVVPAGFETDPGITVEIIAKDEGGANIDTSAYTDSANALEYITLTLDALGAEVASIELRLTVNRNWLEFASVSLAGWGFRITQFFAEEPAPPDPGPAANCVYAEDPTTSCTHAEDAEASGTLTEDAATTCTYAEDI